MTKNIKYILLVCVLNLSIAFANKIAVATKIKGLVEIMPFGKKDFTKLNPGTIYQMVIRFEQVQRDLQQLSLLMTNLH
mgnify:CR=1 FL=1